MRTHLLISSLFGLMLAACGGDDGGGSGGPDAPPAGDAAVDAPAGLVGLGQRCVPTNGGSDCPANASVCLSAAGNTTTGMCSPLCVEGGTMMTNAQAQPASVTPAPSNAACTAAYTGSVGTPLCAIILGGSGPLAYMPPDNPLMANKTYTNVNLACAIQCGANNTCPTGLTPTGTTPCVCQ